MAEPESDGVKITDVEVLADDHYVLRKYASTIGGETGIGAR